MIGEEINIHIKEDEGEDQYADIDNPFSDDVKKTKKRSYKRIKEEEELRLKNSINFWKSVLSNPVGRKEIWEILQDTHAFEERFACGPGGFPQVEATWFHAGEQSYGTRFYHKMMGIDPQAIVVMHKENDPRFVDERNS